MAKIMLVEDDNNLREIYEARLQAEGYTIVSAKDGEEALAVAKAEKPDLVISDVMMPKISGFEMLDILRNTDGLKTVKVIMLTALGQSDDQQRANKLGADKYLVKSQVTLEDIVRVARDLLGEDDGQAAAKTDGPSAPPPPPPSAPSAPPAAAGPPPTAPNSPPATPADPNQQTTSQESASVEAEIEDFVAGATTDAPGPVAPPPADNPSPVTAASTAGNSDDKLMNEAVDDLMDDTADPTKPAKEDESKPPVSPLLEQTEETSTGSVPIAHKKVIHPPDAQKKPDIQALLAKEQAAE